MSDQIQPKPPIDLRPIALPPDGPITRGCSRAVFALAMLTILGLVIYLIVYAFQFWGGQ